jgi:hypothetical protein
MDSPSGNMGLLNHVGWNDWVMAGTGSSLQERWIRARDVFFLPLTSMSFHPAPHQRQKSTGVGIHVDKREADGAAQSFNKEFCFGGDHRL